MFSKYRLAKKVVNEINGNQWIGEWNYISRDVLTIKNGDFKIWVANSCWNCQFYKPKKFNPFGIFSCWVWLSAQKLRKKARIENDPYFVTELDKQKIIKTYLSKD